MIHNELFTGLGCLWEQPRRAEEEERQTQCERDTLGGRLGLNSTLGIFKPMELERAEKERKRASAAPQHQQTEEKTPLASWKSLFPG